MSTPKPLISRSISSLFLNVVWLALALSLILLPDFSGGAESLSRSSSPNSQMVKDPEGDLWFWSPQLIRRYQKTVGIWTYYQAPVVYSQLEVKWDSQRREAIYLLDGVRISAQEAQRFTQPGAGFAVGSKTAVGEPGFTLSVSSRPPQEPSLGRERKRFAESKPAQVRLSSRWQQKYYPPLWQFTALAVSKNFVWVAIRSIPRPAESLPVFCQPDGYQSKRHFRESPLQPIQGGILRIDKKNNNWVRFTEKNGLPKALICSPLKAEAVHLPHFLPLLGFPQEVVTIEPDEKTGLVCFTTRSGQHVWYNEKKQCWEDEAK